MKLTKKQIDNLRKEKKELDKKQIKYGIMVSITLLPIGILSFLYISNSFVLLVIYALLLASIRPAGYFISDIDRLKEINSKLKEAEKR